MPVIAAMLSATLWLTEGKNAMPTKIKKISAVSKKGTFLVLLVLVEMLSLTSCLDTFSLLEICCDRNTRAGEKVRYRRYYPADT